MKYDKYWMRFFQEPDDNKGGGGTQVFEPPAKTTTGEPEPPEPDKPDIPATVEPEPPGVTIDAKTFAKEFGAVIGEHFKKDKEEKPLTAEEAKKLLNVWDPTPEWITKFDNLETRNAAIAEMRDGLIKHADTISQHRLKEMQTALETKFSPLVERLQQIDNEQRESRFGTQFPQLAKPALRPLIEAVMQDLVNKGKKFDDESSMFTAIASGAEAVIKETNPDFKLTAGSSPATKAKSTNSIPVTTPGSGGGIAAGKPATDNPKKGLAIFVK